MFPMITSVAEVRRIKEICAQARRELEAEGKPFDGHAELGIMIETPAAAAVSYTHLAAWRERVLSRRKASSSPVSGRG